MNFGMKLTFIKNSDLTKRKHPNPGDELLLPPGFEPGGSTACKTSTVTIEPWELVTKRNCKYPFLLKSWLHMFPNIIRSVSTYIKIHGSDKVASENPILEF
uniref:Uncharacterized protein n=1 Tax=Cacopsylla melanoneura TaxID=428564 RepID=A0A8D8T766_9HEMI